jgi:hypothetical protein
MIETPKKLTTTKSIGLIQSGKLDLGREAGLVIGGLVGRIVSWTGWLIFTLYWLTGSDGGPGN